MNPPRWVRAGLLSLALLPSCGSVNRDENDHDAFFVDARVRRALDGKADHEGTHVELGWNSAHGDTNGLDYTIGVVTVGFGVDGAAGKDGWVGIVGGLGWQMTDFETTTDDLNADDAIGPWVAFQGGWMIAPWVELFARTDLGMYFEDLNTTFGFETGARFHVADYTAFFVGWRYAAYEFNDFDGFPAFDELELDASGLVVGIDLSF